MNDLSLHRPGPPAALRLPTLHLQSPRDPRIERFLRRAPLAGAVIAIVLAATALLGWLLDLPLLASLGRDAMPLKFNAAVGMLACGVVLLLLDVPARRQRAAARVAAATVALLGAATLVQYATGLDFGIDQWLMRDPAAAGGLPPGRMAPNTALNLVLLGTALLLLMVGGRNWFGAQGLALAALVVAMLSGLGQAYGGVSELGVGALDRMSLPAALGFLALSLGVLCARPDSGWMALFSSAGAGGHVMRSLLPIVVVMPALLGWLRVEGQEAGLFDFRLGAALVALASTAVLAALVIWSARRAEDIDADRRRSHAALRASEEFLQYQIASLPIGYIVWGTDFRVQAWNPAAEAIFGYGSAEARGKHACELIVPAGIRAEIDRAWARLLAGTGALRSVNANHTRDGREITCDWTNVPLRRGGEVTGVLSMVQDITDRRRAEDENARLYGQVRQQALLLERRVRERTAQLESAVKDLEGFSYSVSHDLRAPLRAIDSFSDILLQDYAERLDDEGRRLLGVVRTNTGKMSQLIDDILSFSRAGRREMALAEVDLTALVAEVLQEQQAAAGERHIDFRIGELPKVRADRPALRQVLVNLLANAIKFTRHRAEAVVEVTAGMADGEAVLSVKDNGAGFDPKYQHKLFGVFQRLHGPEEFEGTGIGLAIVKRIVEKHGGRVWAEGQPDAGATFHFSLPRLTPGAIGEAHE